MVKRFYEKYFNGQVQLVATVNAYNIISLYHREYRDGLMDIEPTLCLGNRDLQLVLKDVMKKAETAAYEPKTVSDLTLTHTMNEEYYCFFTFKDHEFFASLVGNKYTICLKDEN